MEATKAIFVRDLEGSCEGGVVGVFEDYRGDEGKTPNPGC